MNSFDPDGLFNGQTISNEPRYYGKTTQALKLVVEHGVEPRDALLMARNGKPPGATALKEFKRKAAKYSLTRPSMVKLAHSVVQNVLSGKADQVTTQKLHSSGKVVEIIEQIAPTHTNKLAAAAMVFDRAEPVVRQNVNLNGDLKDFMPIDLSQFE